MQRGYALKPAKSAQAAAGSALGYPVAVNSPNARIREILQANQKQTEAPQLKQQKLPAGKGSPSAVSCIIQRDTGATARVMARGTRAGSGLQFFPTNVTDTRVGPVSLAGGRRHRRASRLSVIIAANMSPRLLSRELLPLWTSAIPFTPAGATSPLPLDIIDETTLAKALLVHNQRYLPLPDMTAWQVGLRLPLPVQLDETSGMATVNPGLMRRLAAVFQQDWAPLLDSLSVADTVPSPAMLSAEVAAFLSRNPTAGDRGTNLSVRAETNVQALRPFIEAVFASLPSADAFALALAFMNDQVNRTMSLIAAQQDGAAILAQIQTRLNAAPGEITEQQQRGLDRANRMLALVSGASAVAAPAARRQRHRRRRLEMRRSRTGRPCACMVFIHNDERNARRAVEELHRACRYNLAIIDRGSLRSREISVPGEGPADPNELFPESVQTECSANEAACRLYEASHNNRRAMQIQFFLAMKECSGNFALPTIALHNNRNSDTAAFRSASLTEQQQTSLTGEVHRERESGSGSRDDLRTRLQAVSPSVRGRRRPDFSRLLNLGGTTNIFRWCNMPEIVSCHVGDPEHPDFVIWTTNRDDFTAFSTDNFNVVLQDRAAGESATDLSTLYVRLGGDHRYINIETPHSRPTRLDTEAVRRENMNAITSALRSRNLLCCDEALLGAVADIPSPDAGENE
ncbi:hypothetical protein SG34_017355 [Thalassomonas viridans]|uniref:Uncharacterized protein n=1 Tax=Thalassomonas viridans TaxID=137584 RepID=A0AAE9YY59_9GAMM|nr:hypothetical protein [Thalassomonas viridans]WDE03175.1 hypothetical protein SG34_017355 [Thalassomonas viridans]